MKEKNKNFNLIVAGYGGQGVLSLAKIIAQAAFFSKKEVKQAELHGLSQRGGSLECHLRIGKDVFSPLIPQGSADLIISLELLEAWRVCFYANKKKTIILTNEDIVSPFPFQPNKIKVNYILSEIKKYALELRTIKVSEFGRKVSRLTQLTNTMILGWTIGQNLLPIEEKYILKAMKEKFGQRFWSENKRAFDLARKEGEKFKEQLLKK